MNKRIFSTVVLLFLLGSVVAGKVSPASRQINVSALYNKLIVQGNLEVILTTDSSSVITVEGSPADVAGVLVQNRHNRLVIARRSDSKGKVVVRIPVQQLKVINMHGDVRLHSGDILNIDTLHVFLDGTCDVALKAAGKVKITHSVDCVIEYNNSGRKVE